MLNKCEQNQEIELSLCVIVMSPAMPQKRAGREMSIHPANYGRFVTKISIVVSFAHAKLFELKKIKIKL